MTFDWNDSVSHIVHGVHIIEVYMSMYLYIRPWMASK